FGNRTTELRAFDGVGQSCAKEVDRVHTDDLGLALQPSKRVRMYDSVTIDLDGRARIIGLAFSDTEARIPVECMSGS
ncbi:MAG: hypothetical protein JWN41_705, partial [Thermoleophilia bacterium]|nr:hypothetical protein [Thermoleophilia bacterium]